MVTIAMGDNEHEIRECECGKHAYCDCATRVRPIPLEPTDAIPGSEEKIQVMRDRWANGYSIHHPNDIRLAPSSVETYSGMTYLVGIIQALEQLRLRGVK